MNEAIATISDNRNTVKAVGHAKDISGKVFGRWTVLRRIGDAVKNGRKERIWICRCECGVEKSVRSVNLKSGNSTSCGCFQKERMGDVKRIHGMSQSTSEYSIWGMMKQRCLNPKVKNYSMYGGRGITVCQRWAESFENFLADMGLRPSELHSIERVDNNLGYSKQNCVWATGKVQGRNKRTNRVLELNGISKCVSEWSEIYSLPKGTISDRLRRGWSPRRAVTTPIKNYEHAKS